MVTPNVNSQVLPTKEQALFKKLMKCCEQKQYKTGLKLVKQILSNPKCAEHGETIAMKGLIMSCIGKKTEARQLVKRGLLFNLKSHVCWHVSGLIERSDRNYEKAIKCYINALKWDKENIQILRDLSMLQMHIRDLTAFKESRYTLLRLRPTHRVNWIAFAIAHHLLQEYDVAIKLLDQLRVMDTERNFEYSELLLYQNVILQEAGYVDEALNHLNENKEHIVDKLSLLEYKLSLFRSKQDKAHAASLCRSLVIRNPENPKYYRQLIELTGSENSETTLRDFFQQMKSLYPRSETPRFLELEYFHNQSFTEAIETYLKKAFVKGLPALFKNIKPLYKDPKKVSNIESLVLEYCKNLESCQRFIQDNDNKTPEMAPTVLLWVYHFLAQHFDHLDDQTRALDFINKAIEHTPTLLELLMVKAKILKHCGDFIGASDSLDECQSLDTADRYLNCKSAKYLLRANKITEATDMCSKFTREGQEVTENLNEMQCLWFLTETAYAYHRSGSLGECLKKCHQVLRHFDEIWEGQFDFHAYSMRKMTLRAYVQLLKLEDRIYEQRYFFSSAQLAIQIYLHLYDNPWKEAVVDESTLTVAELRKLKKKQEKEAKRAEERKKREEEERQKQMQKQRKDDGDPEGPVFAELVPTQLEKPEDPLKEAEAFLKPLLTYGDHLINAHLLAFEVYYRRGRILLMLRCLRRAHSLDSENATLHLLIVKFVLYFKAHAEEQSSLLKEVLFNQSSAFLPSSLHVHQDDNNSNDSLISFNEQFLQKHSHSLPHFVSYLKSTLLLKKESDTTELLHKLIESLPHKKATLKECIEIQNRIIDGSFGAIDQDYMKTINAAFATKFPLSKYFLENSEESNCNNVVTESKKRNTAPLSNGPHAHLNGYVDELKEGGHDGSKGHCAAENGSTEANQQQQKTCSPDAKTAVMVNGTVSNSNAANDDNCAMGDSQNPATINLNHSI